MKQPEYTEGSKALRNFERLATTLLQAAKSDKRGKGKKKATPSSSLRKQKKSDAARAYAVRPIQIVKDRHYLADNIL
jgi:hypothetical protein